MTNRSNRNEEKREATMSTTYNPDKLAEAIKAFGKERLEELQREYNGRLAYMETDTLLLCNPPKKVYTYYLVLPNNYVGNLVAIHTSITFECIKESDITYLEPPRPLRKEGHTKEEMGLAHALGGTDYALGQQTFEDWYTSTFPTATAPTEEVHEVKGYIDTKNPEKSHIISNTITEENDGYGFLIDQNNKATINAPSPQPQPSFTREEWVNEIDQLEQKVLSLVPLCDKKRANSFFSIFTDWCENFDTHNGFILSIQEAKFVLQGIKGLGFKVDLDHPFVTRLESYLNATKPLPSRLDLLIKWLGQQDRPSEIEFTNSAKVFINNSPKPNSTHYRRGTSEWISLEGVV